MPQGSQLPNAHSCVLRRSSVALTDTETSGPCAGNYLSAFLEQEHFLLKVLAYVVEDGLHECRLVCRRWRDACGKLPVRLNRVSLHNMQEAAEKFPKAQTLYMSGWVNNENVIETHVVPQLKRFEYLYDLSLLLSGYSIDMRNLIACLSSMQNLEFLELCICHEDTLQYFIHDLRYLTKLTSLRLSHECASVDDLVPSSCVTGLRELHTAIELLANDWNELVFPMLTGLTSLSVYDDWEFKDTKPYVRDLQVYQLLHSIVCQLTCVVIEYPDLC